MNHNSMKTILFTFLLLASAQASQKKWNVITVVTDDQSQWSVGCYGQSDIQTPHMDSLAKDGAIFTNAFVNSPVCSPSRATFLTGRHSTELGVTDWLTGGQSQKNGISNKFTSWPEILRQNGYTTGLIGKWHLGSREASLPKNNGFTYFKGNPAGGWHPKKTIFTDNQNKTEPITGDSVNICTDIAIDFIKENKSRPFSLLVHYREPHAPYGPMPSIDEAKTKDLKPAISDYPNLNKNTAKLMRNYLTAVSAVDRNLGRILETLKEQGLEEKTIVIFTSDHGYNIGHHGLRFKGNGYWITTDKKGCRPNMFETSISVPLMIRWPGVVKPGTRVDAMTANIDMLPSITGMLGLQSATPHHGYDFTPLLKGEKPAQWRTEVFGQYQMINDAKHSMRMIRTKDWKLIRHYKVENKDELYDLKNDPGETINLINEKKHAKVISKLQARMDSRMKALKDDPLSKS